MQMNEVTENIAMKKLTGGKVRIAGSDLIYIRRVKQ